MSEDIVKAILLESGKETVSEVDDNVVEHHGVKGMRWGVRTKGGVSKGRTVAGRQAQGRIGATKKKDNRTHFEKSGKRLSDKELQDRIKRMELEKKYNELNQRQVSAGKKATHEILGKTGKTVATTVLTGAALIVVARALDKRFPGAGKEVTGKSVDFLKTAGKEAYEAKHFPG